MSEGERESSSAATSSNAPTVACRSEAVISSSKPAASTAQMEVESLTVNQQLANHMAIQVSGKPSSKRKRGSLDVQRLPLSAKPQQHFEIKKIGFIGAGNMARAIAEGWISSGESICWFHKCSFNLQTQNLTFKYQTTASRFFS